MDNNQMGMEASAQTMPQKKGKGVKVVFIILGIVLAVLLLGVGGFFAWGARETQNLEAGEALIMAFMKDYDRLRLEEAYELFHPDVREETIEDQLDKYNLSDLEELEDYLDMYFGGLELEYEINKSTRLSKEELEDALSEVYSTFRVRLDISQAYAYQVTATFSGKNGTLKVVDQYIVAKEDGEWYIIAVFTKKVVKNDVTFTLAADEDEVLDTLEAFIEAYRRLDMDSAYRFYHPNVKDAVTEMILNNFSLNSLDEYADFLNEYYGGYSIEYELLQSKDLSDSECENFISQVEEYYSVQFDSDFSDVWACQIQETISGDNGTAVIIETLFFGKQDGTWYILDISTDEHVSSDVQIPDQGSSAGGYDASEGFDSGEEALEQFIREYGNMNIEASYEAVHPALREAFLQVFLANKNASSVEEYEAAMTNSYGSFTFTYEISEQYTLSGEELEAFLAHIYEAYGVQLDISVCNLYAIVETYETGNDTENLTEVIAVGKDGNKWFVVEALTIG